MKYYWRYQESLQAHEELALLITKRLSSLKLSTGKWHWRKMYEGWQSWLTLALIGLMLVALVLEVAPPYLVMMGTLVILLGAGVLDVAAAFHGFADEAMLSIAVLFIVAKGIELSGGLEYVSRILFRTPAAREQEIAGVITTGSKDSLVWVLLKFSLPVAIFSAFLANIPLVAMMIPPIVEFAKKVHVSPSKMLMPLSYAAQLGGTMTLIGAGTNLVVLSMAAQKLPDLKMNLFEIGVIGVPVTVAGILYIIAVSGKMLPDRLAIQPTNINAREYNVVLVVKPNSRLARKSIEQAGVTRTPGLHLVQVDRDGSLTANPKSDFILLPKDRLHFAGVIDSILSLVQFHGLALSEDEGHEQIDLNLMKTNQCLVEAVVASASPLTHKKVSDLQFRTRYGAAVVAVHRHGTRLHSDIGSILIEGGDCLLMVAEGSEFVSKHRNNSTFALVSKLPGFVPIQRRRAAIAAVLVMGMVVASGVGVKLITAALFSAAGLLITKCLTPRDAMTASSKLYIAEMQIHLIGSVIFEQVLSYMLTLVTTSASLQEAMEMPVLIMIAAAFGISEAMVETGAANLVAKALMGLAGKSLFGLILCTYVATTIFSLAITNNAAVTIMFPVALAAASQEKLDFRPFAYTLMMAASAGFMTPTGCPTNLMVYTPGGYKFSDYMKFGGPMQIWLLFITVGITMTAKWWWLWWGATIVLAAGATPILARQKFNFPSASPVNGLNSKPQISGTDEDYENTTRNPGDVAVLSAPGQSLPSNNNFDYPQQSGDPESVQTVIPSSFPFTFPTEQPLSNTSSFKDISISSTSDRYNSNFIENCSILESFKGAPPPQELYLIEPPTYFAAVEISNTDPPPLMPPASRITQHVTSSAGNTNVSYLSKSSFLKEEYPKRGYSNPFENRTMFSSPSLKASASRTSHTQQLNVPASNSKTTLRKPSLYEEEDLTGGISNLLQNRKLSTMLDSSSFSDLRLS